MSVIYEPRGKAREYSSLAVNLYTGCGHGCEYCYAPAAIGVSKNTFANPEPREGIIEKLIMDSRRLAEQNEHGPVLMCFTCDPYQPIDEQYRLTRQAIQVLHSHNIKVLILTKGGRQAGRDFDLLTVGDWFGVTLTNLDDAFSLKWEPLAALPDARINSLHCAHDKGIKTWVSLEPVLYPEITLEIIRKTHNFADMFKVGTLNYHSHAKTIDWHKFALDVKKLLSELNCNYYLKDDLRRWL